MDESPDSAHDRGTPPSTPRWVWAFGIIAVLAILVGVIVHLSGGGFHGMHGIPR